ncbi:MAG: hypothetical protein AABX75_03360 [Nanoarchaeota archaeon]
MVDKICVVCNESVYATICALCLTDRTEAWLEGKKLSMTREFRQQVRLFLDSLKKRSTMRCSMCRTETIATCHMCYLENIGGWLARKDKGLAVDFVKGFNTGLISNSFKEEIYA